MVRALVVDDEPFVTLLASDDLRLAGFDVKWACNGDEALAILEQDGDWDLLMTDIRMPGAIDGWALARAALVAVPRIRVIYASGYVDQPTDLSDRERFVTKPYDIDDLKKALQGLGFDIH